jgi:hypothetical protein
MTTNSPVELGKASEQTKTRGLGAGDSVLMPFAQQGT